MFRRIGFGLLAALAVVVGLLVGTFNADKVSLDLLWVQLDWPLGLLLLCAFSLGLVLGLALLYVGKIIPMGLKLRKLEAGKRQTEATDLTRPDA